MATRKERRRTVSPKSSVSTPQEELDRIVAFNRGRIPELVERKYEAMADGAFEYFRGTAHLFYERLSDQSLAASPLVWTSGDTHLENLRSRLFRLEVCCKIRILEV